MIMADEQLDAVVSSHLLESAFTQAAEENNEVSVPASQVATNSQNDKAMISKLSAQLKRLTEANGKYKNLLKLAKDRIENVEEELEELRKSKQSLEERLLSDENEAAGHIALDEANEKLVDAEAKIVNVPQRIKVAVNAGDSLEEIWALTEMELERETDAITGPVARRWKEWKRFDSETQLQDFIRRDTGEPLTLPPYSLTPEQSARIEKESEIQVSRVTEEFRRFRVRAELARKQADAQIRELQNIQVQKTAERISEQAVQKELDKARSMESQVQKLKAEMTAQEAHWKELYESLLAENISLKSSGSEALLASQWRQRYETCLKEKQEIELKLGSNSGGRDKYEAKYRDLKESFRLYRKKAKEIFEAQQCVRNGALASSVAMNITSNSSADAKLSYLKNLMLNYLSSDVSVRGHMEVAIGTVLQFTEKELEQISKKKAENGSWF